MTEIKEILKMTQMSKASIEKCASFVPKDKWAWRPSETARSAQQSIGHAATSVQMMTKVLKGEKIDFRGMDHGKMRKAEEKQAKTFEEGKELLDRSWKEFEATVNRLSAADIMKTVEMPWGKRTYADIVKDTGWELSYIFAQLQYLQTIWGDLEDHFAM